MIRRATTSLDASCESLEALLRRMAELTGTNREDWFGVFKARHGMKVALEQASADKRRNEVICQLFTCITAIDPIFDAGLVPRYEDISARTLALNPRLVCPGAQTRAVVLQNTYGIIDIPTATTLARLAHDNGAILMEDSAHCVGRMAKNSEGQPVADVSIHSFGVEKMLNGIYFGGAVWVNPAMADAAARSRICESLAGLAPMSPRLQRATKSYRNHIRVLTRLPQGAASALRAHLIHNGSFEPAVSDDERRAKLSHKPLRPSEWVCKQALEALDGLGQNEAQRSESVRIYREAFASEGLNPEDLFVPDAIADMPKTQPLLRFPVFLRDEATVDQALGAVFERGLFAQAWPRPLLIPGALDLAAYNIQNGFESWPESQRLSKRVLGLPTDINTAAEVAHDVARVARANR